MLATVENQMAGTMSFASLTNAVAIATEHRSARNVVRLLFKCFILYGDLLKRSKYFASI
jgi:hypothetical protein